LLNDGELPIDEVGLQELIDSLSRLRLRSLEVGGVASDVVKRCLHIRPQPLLETLKCIVLLNTEWLVLPDILLTMTTSVKELSLNAFPMPYAILDQDMVQLKQAVESCKALDVFRLMMDTRHIKFFTDFLSQVAPSRLKHISLIIGFYGGWHHLDDIEKLATLLLNTSRYPALRHIHVVVQGQVEHDDDWPELESIVSDRLAGLPERGILTLEFRNECPPCGSSSGTVSEQDLNSSSEHEGTFDAVSDFGSSSD